MSIVPFANAPPTLGMVVFDAAAQTAFVAMFPEFTNTPLASLQGYFGIATLMLDNTGCSVVQDANQRQTLLFLLVAHIALLMVGTAPAAGAATAANGMIGRIASAAQGSVSVSTAFAEISNDQLMAYLQQTKYGVQYLAATATYRTMQYVPAACSDLNAGQAPFGGNGLNGWGGLPFYGWNG